MVSKWCYFFAIYSEPYTHGLVFDSSFRENECTNTVCSLTITEETKSAFRDVFIQSQVASSLQQEGLGLSQLPSRVLVSSPSLGRGQQSLLRPQEPLFYSQAQSTSFYSLVFLALLFFLDTQISGHYNISMNHREWLTWLGFSSKANLIFGSPRLPLEAASGSPLLDVPSETVFYMAKHI